jgi:hypothetical protein
VRAIDASGWSGGAEVWEDQWSSALVLNVLPLRLFSLFPLSPHSLTPCLMLSRESLSGLLFSPRDGPKSRNPLRKEGNEEPMQRRNDAQNLCESLLSANM